MSLVMDVLQGVPQNVPQNVPVKQDWLCQPCLACFLLIILLIVLRKKFPAGNGSAPSPDDGRSIFL